MIEVVEIEDLNELSAIADDGPDGKSAALSIIDRIINRMPRPRAYVCEPRIDADTPQSLLWTVAYDILTAMLPAEDHISVIEPDTLRLLASRTPSLLHFVKLVNPFVLRLAMPRWMNSLFLPDDGCDQKRNAEIRRRATRSGVTVIGYRPEFETVRTRRVSPPTS